ncbi:DUF6125 family protein [Oceanidesulfovibrio marinus]|uniref:Cytosolic protein n=1 Tax=Oceanidesulfovibrio marinus TaxID=370038 RepID=A0ABX6NGC4_9BACT|nr:DUF6125 family protein [Oceanidesulfovibrio marinus]QJT09677.1 cytosolic protein [Oceanidesulfovibrio marinus]
MAHSEQQTELVREILEILRRTAIHYGLWYAEAERQLGTADAHHAEMEAGDRLQAILLGRLSKILGMGVTEDGLPQGLVDLDVDTLQTLRDGMATNWLAADGVWFQAIENRISMHDAKRVNDTCWTKFSPYEALRIKSLLELPEFGGLPALQTALAHRIYARVNPWEIVEDREHSFVFRMKSCRVQTARTRKGLAEYPCKSGGMVEYRTFAHAIDPRIQTECVACPPDTHPEDWVCAWRFTVA